MRPVTEAVNDKVTAPCSDCKMPTTMSRTAIDRGARNRDPGEIICPSCNGSRTVLIRKVMALPDTLHQIQSMRMAH